MNDMILQRHRKVQQNPQYEYVQQQSNTIPSASCSFSTKNSSSSFKCILYLVLYSIGLSLLPVSEGMIQMSLFRPSSTRSRPSLSRIPPSSPSQQTSKLFIPPSIDTIESIRERRISSTALQMVLTTPEYVIEQASTQKLLDDLIDESVKTSARTPIIMQINPTPYWIWRRWKGTVFSESWPTCIRNMLFATLVAIFYTVNPGMRDKLVGFGVLWGQLLSVTTFTLTFFLNVSYGLWRKCYELSRRLQGRLNDLSLTLAAHADRTYPSNPDERSTFTPQAKQILELIARYIRLFNLLTYASFTRSHRPILTPKGMRRLVERGILTQSELTTLIEAEVPPTQRHNAVLLWIIRVFIEARQAGHFAGGAGFEQQFMEKCHVIRAQYGAIGDELQGRMPLAYAHIVQVLVDVILCMYPFMAFTSQKMSAWLGILGTGLLTIFYQGLFDLAKRFLDPYDNENYGNGDDPLCIDTLIAESNAGSVRWFNGLHEIPFNRDKLKEGELGDLLLPLRGYSVEQLKEREKEEKEKEMEAKKRKEEELKKKREKIQEFKEQTQALSQNSNTTQNLPVPTVSARMINNSSVGIVNPKNIGMSSQESALFKAASFLEELSGKNSTDNISSGSTTTAKLSDATAFKKMPVLKDILTNKQGQQQNSTATLKNNTEDAPPMGFTPVNKAMLSYDYDATQPKPQKQKETDTVSEDTQPESGSANNVVNFNSRPPLEALDDDSENEFDDSQGQDEVDIFSQKSDDDSSPASVTTKGTAFINGNNNKNQGKDIEKPAFITTTSSSSPPISSNMTSTELKQTEPSNTTVDVAKADSSISITQDSVDISSATAVNGDVPAVVNDNTAVNGDTVNGNQIPPPPPSKPSPTTTVNDVLKNEEIDHELLLRGLEGIEWHEKIGPDGNEIRLSQMLADEDYWDDEDEHHHRHQQEEQPNNNVQGDDGVQDATRELSDEEKEYHETQAILNARFGDNSDFDTTSSSSQTNKVASSTKNLQNQMASSTTSPSSSGGVESSSTSSSTYDQTKLDSISQLWGAGPNDLEGVNTKTFKERQVESLEYSSVSQLWHGASLSLEQGSGTGGTTSSSGSLAQVSDPESGFDSVSQLWGNDYTTTKVSGTSTKNNENGSADSSETFTTLDFPESSLEGFEWFDEVGPDGKEYRLSQLLADEEWEEEIEDTEPMTFEDFSKQVVEQIEKAEDERLETEAILSAPFGASTLQEEEEEKLEDNDLSLVGMNKTQLLSEEEEDEEEFVQEYMSADEIMETEAVLSAAPGAFTIGEEFEGDNSEFKSAILEEIDNSLTNNTIEEVDEECMETEEIPICDDMDVLEMDTQTDIEKIIEAAEDERVETEAIMSAPFGASAHLETGEEINEDDPSSFDETTTLSSPVQNNDDVVDSETMSSIEQSEMDQLVDISEDEIKETEAILNASPGAFTLGEEFQGEESEFVTNSTDTNGNSDDSRNKLSNEDWDNVIN